MTRRILFLLLFGAAALPLGAAEVTTELKDEWKAGITLDLEVKARLNLVDRVAACDTRTAADLLVSGLDDLSADLGRAIDEMAKVEKELWPLDSETDVLKDQYKRRDELRARRDMLDDLLIADQQVVDHISAAMTRFTSEEARKVVAQAATRGSNWRTKAACARAAAVHPGDAGRDAALKALSDKDPRVAVAALAGLGKRADETTVDGVAKCLGSDEWTVQVSAADALAAIGSKRAVRPLVEALPKTTGRVQADVNRALRKITGQSFEADYEVWKRWYEEHKAELEGADAKPLRGGGGKPVEAGDSSYYGIQSKSKRIIYILDISGSMDVQMGGPNPVSPRDGEEERESGTKLDVARKELKNSIRKLPEDAKFNIITYNHEVKVWNDKMLPATQDNKNKSYLFVNDLQPRGSTYTYGALREAFRFAGMGATDKHYESGVDTIFLLSDGAPTDQTFPTSKLMEPDEILVAVRQWNSLGKVVIHAIAVDPKTQGSDFIQFMKRLAEQNGGQYAEKG